MYRLARSLLRHRAPLTAIAAGGALAAAYAFSGSSIVQSVIYDGLGASACAAAAIRARRSRAGTDAPWALIAGALLLWTSGDVVSDVSLLGQGSLSFPSAADILYLCGYPALAVGFFAMGRRLFRAPLRVGLLDAAIVGVTASVVAWFTIIDPGEKRPGHELWVKLVVILYPLADIVVVFVLAHILIAGRRLTPALGLLTAAMVVQLVADTGYTLQETDYAIGGALDFGWMAAYAFFVAAAFARDSRPREWVRSSGTPGGLRLALLGGALAVSPVVLLTGPLDARNSLVLGVGAAILWLLVMTAAGSSFRRVEQLGRELAGKHERLLQSEERLRLIFECSSLAIAITDDRRQLIAINPRALQMTGYSEAEFEQLGIAGVTHPEDIEVDSHLFRELMTGERDSFKSLKRFVHKDGSVIWGRVSYSVARDPAGNVRFAIGMVEDVTQQRTVEEERDAAFEATRTSEARFRGAFDGGGIGMAIVTPDGRFLRVNGAFCAITGYEQDELLDRSLVEITHPEDVALSLAYRNELVSLADMAPRSLEKRYIRKDGSVVWAELTIAVVRNPRGEPLYHVTHVRDLTAERRLAEERAAAEQDLRNSRERSWTLLSRMLELLFVIDADGCFAWANRAAEDALGHAPGGLVGLHDLDVVHPDDASLVESALALGTRSGESDGELLTYRLRRLDGSWRTVEARGINLLDDPLIHGILVSARDVTERAEMERARERLEFDRRVAQRLEAVGQLAAGIAHEINTPIQFVGDSVRFLDESFDDLEQLRARYRGLLVEHGLAAELEVANRDTDLGYLSERVPAAFARIADGVERVTSIVRAMQRFAHAPQAERAPADLGDALQATATVCRNEYKYVADLELELAELPPVLCNVGDLNQVFLNLIVNAAHAIAERIGDDGGRGTITVRTRLDEAAEQVVVEVADDGCGIPLEAQERIFEPFFTTKDVGRGTGQGLAIARSIVEQHGGTIAFTTEPNEGTTFVVRLPARPAVAEAA